MDYYGDEDMSETARFVHIFDKFFDVLNTRHTDEAILKRKPNLSPYRTSTDSRLKVEMVEIKTRPTIIIIIDVMHTTVCLE